MDCGADTYVTEEFFMLRTGLWKSINHRIDGMLCLRCTERRLGRLLCQGDFTSARINERQARLCALLAERLNRRGQALRRSSQERSNKTGRE
jgi:hypothetical protein